MSPQAEDDWWNRLYDESTPDTGPTMRSDDTLDSRFDEASDTVTPSIPDPRAAPVSENPDAWWESSSVDGQGVAAGRSERTGQETAAGQGGRGARSRRPEGERPPADVPPPSPRRPVEALSGSTDEPGPPRSAPPASTDHRSLSAKSAEGTGIPSSTDSPPSAGSVGRTDSSGGLGHTDSTGRPSGPRAFPLTDWAPGTIPPPRPPVSTAPSTPTAASPAPVRPGPVPPHRPRPAQSPTGADQPEPPTAPPAFPSSAGSPPVPRPRAPWESPLPEPSAATPVQPPVQPPVPPAEPPPAESPPPPRVPSSSPSPPQPPSADAPQRPAVPPAFARPPGPGTTGSSRPRTGYVGDRPPTYDPEPTTLPAATPEGLGQLIADTVLDGARYGSYTLRAASVRGDSSRYRGEARRDALLTARFGTGVTALVLVAVASGARGVDGSYRAAADACRWIGGAVGRSHARLSEDIRAGRRGALKSGLHRLTDRSMGKLRASALEAGAEPGEYAVGLRCLLLSADPECRTRVYFGVGPGGLFRLREGVWQDIEPALPGPEATVGGPVLGYGSTVPPRSPGQSPSLNEPAETQSGDRLTMDLGIPTPPAPFVEAPPEPPAEPFRFRASVAKPGDTLLLCSPGLAEPFRSEPACSGELASRWASPTEPPGLAAFLADVQIRVKGYADDRTAVAVWET